MPTYDLAAIRSELETLLGTVPTVSFVYPRRNPTIEGYPCIIFDIVSADNEMLTNVQNERTLVFRIWLVQEIGNAGMETANQLLDDLTKDTIAILEDTDNISLDGNVDWIMPVEGAREEVSSPQGSAIWQILDLQVRVVSSVL